MSNSRRLEFVIRLKIFVTVLFWCIPSLFFPISVFQKLGFPAPYPAVNLRLLGVAYAALLVNYYFGSVDIKRGKYPKNAIWVGVVSNGGASSILLFYGLQSSWVEWGKFAQIYMWFSFAAVSVITFGLIIFGVLKKNDYAE